MRNLLSIIAFLFLAAGLQAQEAYIGLRMSELESQLSAAQSSDDRKEAAQLQAFIRFRRGVDTLEQVFQKSLFDATTPDSLRRPLTERLQAISLLRQSGRLYRKAVEAGDEKGQESAMVQYGRALSTLRLRQNFATLFNDLQTDKLQEDAERTHSSNRDWSRLLSSPPPEMERPWSIWLDLGSQWSLANYDALPSSQFEADGTGGLGLVIDLGGSYRFYPHLSAFAEFGYQRTSFGVESNLSEPGVEVEIIEQYNQSGLAARLGLTYHWAPFRFSLGYGQLFLSSGDWMFEYFENGSILISDMLTLEEDQQRISPQRGYVLMEFSYTILPLEVEGQTLQAEAFLRPLIATTSVFEDDYLQSNMLAEQFRVGQLQFGLRLRF